MNYHSPAHRKAMQASTKPLAFYLPRKQADEPAWAISEHSIAAPASRGWKTWTLIALAFALLAALLAWRLI